MVSKTIIKGSSPLGDAKKYNEKHKCKKYAYGRCYNMSYTEKRHDRGVSRKNTYKHIQRKESILRNVYSWRKT